MEMGRLVVVSLAVLDMDTRSLGHGGFWADGETRCSQERDSL